MLATALRWHGLGSWAFEQDELYTLRSSLDLRFNVRPVYYLLLHALLEVFPPTELVLRGPAFVFGVLGVWVTWLLGRDVFGRPAAHVAALLVALSPWHLHLSQFARYYSLVYLLSALTLLLLLRAVDRDTPRTYLAALITITVGCLSHPSFALPLLGVVLAVSVIGADGHTRRPLPTRRAVLYLWGPLAGIGLLAGVVLRAAGGVDRLRAGDGNSLRVVLLRLSGVAEAITPEAVVAALFGAAFLLVAAAGRGDRRWGAAALLGGTTTVVLLVTLSFWTNVHVDYATGMLPLVFVTIGGFVQRSAALLRAGRRTFAVAIAAILVAGLLPGSLSHLSDGTRYDFRPAYAHVVAAGGDHLIMSWPEIIQRHYAPGRRFEALRHNEPLLERTLAAASGFWLIGRYNRFGLMSDRGRVQPWIEAHCRMVLHTHRPRLDFRMHRVELHWCGDGAPPQPQPQRMTREG